MQCNDALDEFECTCWFLLLAIVSCSYLFSWIVIHYVTLFAWYDTSVFCFVTIKAGLKCKNVAYFARKKTMSLPPGRGQGLCDLICQPSRVMHHKDLLM